MAAINISMPVYKTGNAKFSGDVGQTLKGSKKSWLQPAAVSLAKLNLVQASLPARKVKDVNVCEPPNCVQTLKAQHPLKEISDQPNNLEKSKIAPSQYLSPLQYPHDYQQNSGLTLKMLFSLSEPVFHKWQNSNSAAKITECQDVQFRIRPSSAQVQTNNMPASAKRVKQLSATRARHLSAFQGCAEARKMFSNDGQRVLSLDKHMPSPKTDRVSHSHSYLVSGERVLPLDKHVPSTNTDRSSYALEFDQHEIPQFGINGATEVSNCFLASNNTKDQMSLSTSQLQQQSSVMPLHLHLPIVYSDSDDVDNDVGGGGEDPDIDRLSLKADEYIDTTLKTADCTIKDENRLKSVISDSNEDFQMYKNEPCQSDKLSKSKEATQSSISDTKEKASPDENQIRLNSRRFLNDADCSDTTPQVLFAFSKHLAGSGAYDSVDGICQGQVEGTASCSSTTAEDNYFHKQSVTNVNFAEDINHHRQSVTNNHFSEDSNCHKQSVTNVNFAEDSNHHRQSVTNNHFSEDSNCHMQPVTNGCFTLDCSYNKQCSMKDNLTENRHIHTQSVTDHQPLPLLNIKNGGSVDIKNSDQNRKLLLPTEKCFKIENKGGFISKGLTDPTKHCPGSLLSNEDTKNPGKRLQSKHLHTESGNSAIDSKEIEKCLKIEKNGGFISKGLTEPRKQWLGSLLSDESTNNPGKMLQSKHLDAVGGNSDVDSNEILQFQGSLSDRKSHISLQVSVQTRNNKNVTAAKSNLRNAQKNLRNTSMRSEKITHMQTRVADAHKEINSSFKPGSLTCEADVTVGSSCKKYSSHTGNSDDVLANFSSHTGNRSDVSSKSKSNRNYRSVPLVTANYENDVGSNYVGYKVNDLKINASEKVEMRISPRSLLTVYRTRKEKNYDDIACSSAGLTDAGTVLSGTHLPGEKSKPWNRSKLIKTIQTTDVTPHAAGQLVCKGTIKTRNQSRQSIEDNNPQACHVQVYEPVRVKKRVSSAPKLKSKPVSKRVNSASFKDPFKVGIMSRTYKKPQPTTSGERKLLCSI